MWRSKLVRKVTPGHFKPNKCWPGLKCIKVIPEREGKREGGKKRRDKHVGGINMLDIKNSMHWNYSVTL